MRLAVQIELGIHDSGSVRVLRRHDQLALAGLRLCTPRLRPSTKGKRPDAAHLVEPLGHPESRLKFLNPRRPLGSHGRLVHLQSVQFLPDEAGATGVQLHRLLPLVEEPLATRRVTVTEHDVAAVVFGKRLVGVLILAGRVAAFLARLGRGDVGLVSMRTPREEVVLILANRQFRPVALKERRPFRKVFGGDLRVDVGAGAVGRHAARTGRLVLAPAHTRVGSLAGFHAVTDPSRRGGWCVGRRLDGGLVVLAPSFVTEDRVQFPRERGYGLLLHHRPLGGLGCAHGFGELGAGLAAYAGRGGFVTDRALDDCFDVVGLGVAADMVGHRPPLASRDGRDVEPLLTDSSHQITGHLLGRSVLLVRPGSVATANGLPRLHGIGVILRANGGDRPPLHVPLPVRSKH